MKKKTLKEQIFNVLKKAGRIKDRIVPLCSKKTLHYQGKKIGYTKCLKCFPFYQPERSKREDSQKCEMRCSEHCGNIVRDK